MKCIRLGTLVIKVQTNDATKQITKEKKEKNNNVTVIEEGKWSVD